MKDHTKPDPPPGFFKNGSAFVDPQEYCGRDGLTKAEYVEARRPAPVPPPVRKCTVCRHPEKARIEALRVSGVSLEALAEQFSLGRDAVFRHCKSHMTAETKASYLLGSAKIANLAEQAAREGRSVLDYLVIVRSILMNQLAREAELNRSYAVERVAGRLIDVLKEIGGHTGEVQRLAGTVFNIQNNVSILNSPEFTTLQQGLLEVCARHPEARQDIIALFQDLDRRHADPAPAKLIEAKVMEAAQ
jgi:hypothetical protein